MIGKTKKATQTLQIEIYQFLINLLKFLQHYILLADGNEREIKDLSNKHEAIIKVFNIKNLRPDLIFSFYLILSQEYMKLGNIDEILNCLKEYINNVTSNIYPLKLKGDEFFSLIEDWIDDFPIGNHVPRDESLIRKSMYISVADNPIYKELKNNEEYKVIIQRLKNNSKINK